LKGKIFLHHGRAARVDFFFFCLSFVLLVAMSASYATKCTSNL
jgi:hypothetical protein